VNNVRINGIPAIGRQSSKVVQCGESIVLVPDLRYPIDFITPGWEF